MTLDIIEMKSDEKLNRYRIILAQSAGTETLKCLNVILATLNVFPILFCHSIFQIFGHQNANKFTLLYV